MSNPLKVVTIRIICAESDEQEVKDTLFTAAQAVFPGYITGWDIETMEDWRARNGLMMKDSPS